MALPKVAINEVEVRAVMKAKGWVTWDQAAEGFQIGRATLIRAIGGSGFRSDTVEALIGGGCRPSKVIVVAG